MSKILNHPFVVIFASLLLAGLIGFYEYNSINASIPAYSFTTATEGTIQTTTQNQNVSLSFLGSGQVTKINVKEGTHVTTGQVLANLDTQNTLGSLTQARASYVAAKANYDKLINGATNADVAVTNAALLTAQTNLQHSKDSLSLALQNANLSAINAIANTDIVFDNPYTSAVQLITTNGLSFSNQSLAQQVLIDRQSVNAILNNLKSGQSDLNSAQTNLQIISNYLLNLNSLFNQYALGNQTAIAINQTAIKNSQTTINSQVAIVSGESQAVTNAQTQISQAQANLNLKTTSARPEDIAAAKAQMSGAFGAVQIAEAAYQNRLIVSPGTGIIKAIYITRGQNISTNTIAMDFSGKTTSKNVSILIPNNSIINQNGKTFVLVKSGNNALQKEITIGVSDATSTEILSGINAGDQIVTN